MRKVLLILVPLIVLGIALAGTHILVERLFILIAIILLLGYLYAFLSLWGLKGGFKQPDEHIQAARPFQVDTLTHNRSFIPKAFIQMWLKTGLRQTEFKTSLNIPARSIYTWQNPLTFPQRGHNKLGPFIAEAGDPFGLFRLRRHLEPPKEVLVYPDTVDLPYFTAESNVEMGVLRAHSFI
jgi:uncharacterized protein (DUF58 family)